MRKSSIHFKPANIEFSERHNTRKVIPGYVIDTGLENESWTTGKTLPEELVAIEVNAKEVGKRKLQKNANPIKEAVVVLDKQHTIEDLKQVGKMLEEKYNIEILQLYVHRDEGKDKNKINYHGHIICAFWDKKKGKSVRFSREDMSHIQTDVAKVLRMRRGEFHSKRTRLEHQDYRKQMEDVVGRYNLYIERSEKIFKKEVSKDFIFELVKELQKLGMSEEEAIDKIVELKAKAIGIEIKNNNQQSQGLRRK